MANLTDAYATALAAIAAETHGAEREEAAQNLFAALKRRGHERLLPKIYREYTRHRATRSRQDGGLLRVAPTMSKTKRDTLSEQVVARYQLDPAELDVREDDTLIDGYRFESRTRVEDASAKHSLFSLYRQLINHTSE